MFASRLPIASKILSIVALLGMVVVAIGSAGWFAAQVLDEEIQSVAASGKAEVLAARMNTNIQAMNALQFQLVADPSAKAREQVAKALGRERELFTSRMASAGAVLGDTGAGLDRIAQLDKGFAGYVAALDKVQVAAATGDQAALTAASSEAAKLAADLREVARAFFKGAEDHSAALLAQADDNAHQAQIFVLAIAVVGMALGLGFAWGVARWGITKPLNESVAALGGLAEGRLDTEITGTERGDEIGQVARAMAVFKQRLVHERELAAEAEIHRKAELARAEKVTSLTRAFEDEVRSVLTTVGGEVERLEATSAAMTEAARTASERAQAAAAAALQASSNVATVASAAEELSSSITEIGRQVSQANTVSHQATDEAGHTNELVRQLAEAAARIGDVVGTITAIAHQTNMLALNATIEAARAGELGRGFAVVAGEVKGLATQTADATHDVSTQVGAVRDGVHEAVAAITHIAATISQVGEASAGIASAVEQQAAATAEIARNVEQAAAGTGEVSANMAAVEQAATATGEAAMAVKDVAHGVAEDAQKLRIMVEGFLTGMRAA
ncbi:MAG TPA: methyl-accepting chemotaxis protein [Candidatus Omnitrophota bacterium]|nr:methyl-accepting chemotaxis protein [Candidatus Omnitrophota bacterium]